MYTFDDLVSLKYGQLIELAKKYDVYKARSKKVYLAKKIFLAQNEDSESKENDVICKNLPCLELNDDKRRETFLIESPDRKVRKKHQSKKNHSLAVLDGIADENLIVGKKVPSSPELGGDRRDTFTIESSDCKISPKGAKRIRKKRQQKEKNMPVLKEIVDEDVTVYKNGLDLEVDSRNRRETFTVGCPDCNKSPIVERKIQKKTVTPILEEISEEKAKVYKNESNSEFIDDNKRETFLIESSASETSQTVMRKKRKRGRPKKQACETNMVAEGKENKKQARTKKQELGTTPSTAKTKKSQKKKNHLQFHRISEVFLPLPIFDEIEEDGNITTKNSRKKSSTPKRRGTFTLEVSDSTRSLKRENTFSIFPQEKAETTAEPTGEILLTTKDSEIAMDERKCKTPELCETVQLKCQGAKKESFNLKDFKSIIPKTEPGKVEKMNVFERLHANISLSERRSINAKPLDKLQTPKSEKRGVPLSKKLNFSSTTPFRSQNDKKIRFSTSVKERKQQLVALRESKVNKTPLAKRSVLNMPAITKRISKAATPVKSVNNATPFKAKHVPNFNEIHAKKFDLMENIKDFQERHLQRAQMLLSPPTLKQKSENSFSKKADSKLSSNPKPATKKSMIPVAKSRTHLYKSIMGKVPPSTMERIREKETKLLKGVRTNKRFQLQLASSIKNKI